MVFQIVVLCSSYFSITQVLAQEYTPSPRWAQAVALLENTLYVHGGLSDLYNSYSYTSAPEISDLLVLDLSTSFDSSSPPWQLFSANSSPALAWHTLSAFDPSELLLFGGQTGPNSLTVLPTLNDSSGVLSTSDEINPSFHMEPKNWANEPMRRIRHSASFAGGKVWIVGGEKADGSGNAFSEHYAFNPAGPEFALLSPSSNAPPDLYGHVSLVLPDGRLLVLGGYCPSCLELVPMNKVWSLNITVDPPAWEELSVSDASFPSPRRDFAAVVLPNGQVLIHGGGDAQLQTTYGDGWLLDTGQNPMVWKGVAALAQLGQRKDHFAVQAGGYVLFCFGYGSSSPASASLLIYDPMTSSIVTSYIAPSPGSTPAITSLPAPTQTGSNTSPDGGTSTTSPAFASGSPSSSSGTSTDSTHHLVAIALGTTFGVLGLVAIGLATVYYARRGRNRDGRTSGRFTPLEDNPEFLPEEGSVGGGAPETEHLNSHSSERARAVGIQSMITDILAQLGISKFTSRPYQPRKDMFVDEDTRSFVRTGLPSTARWQESEGTSIWSLRSVSALVRGVIGRESSGSGVNQEDPEWEKINHRLEGGQDLIRQGSFRSTTSSLPSHRRDGSFYSYTDPFEDPLSDDDYDHLNLHPSVPEKNADYDFCVRKSDETSSSEWAALDPQDSVWPFSERPRLLTPLREVSQTSLTDPPYSLPSLQDSSHGEICGPADNSAFFPPSSPSSTTNSPTLSRPSVPQPVVLAPRYSTVSGSTLSHSPSITRPDSWWTRISKPPFLDRRASITSTKPLRFRDPTPPPLLVASEETKKPTAVIVRSDDTLDVPVGHNRSLSSTHSGRTANTNSAEHLGGTHDVVQRLASDGSSLRRAASLGSAEMAEQGLFANPTDDGARADVTPSSNLLHVDPPPSTLSPASCSLSMGAETRSDPLRSPKPDVISPWRGALVDSRVNAYERKISQEIESRQIPLPRNTRRLEEVPSRSRPTIQYGVAPRASLYITNPDLGHIS